MFSFVNNRNHNTNYEIRKIDLCTIWQRSARSTSRWRASTSPKYNAQCRSLFVVGDFVWFGLSSVGVHFYSDCLYRHCSRSSKTIQRRDSFVFRFDLTFLAFARQFVDVRRYVHSLEIVHRDVKPENLLIDRFGHIKVSSVALFSVLIVFVLVFFNKKKIIRTRQSVMIDPKSVFPYRVTADGLWPVAYRRRRCRLDRRDRRHRRY